MRFHAKHETATVAGFIMQDVAAGSFRTGKPTHLWYDDQWANPDVWGRWTGADSGAGRWRDSWNEWTGDGDWQRQGAWDNNADSDSSELLSPTQMWGPAALQKRLDASETITQTQPMELSKISYIPESRRQQLEARIQALTSILAMPNLEEAWAEVVRYVTLCCDEETAGMRCSYRFFYL